VSPRRAAGPGEKPPVCHSLITKDPVFRRIEMNLTSLRARLVLVVIALCTASAALAEDQKARAAPPMEQHALDLLKAMSDKLAAANSFTFTARDTIEAPGGNGQLLNFFAKTEVAVVRPDKISAKIRGDAPPFDFYFDGASMTVLEPTEKLYATTEAPKTIDEMLLFAAKKAGIILPFADLLFSDPYAAMTKGLTSAFYAGTSQIGGVECEHLAFAAPGIEWQIWINPETSLPRLLMGAMLDVQGAPRFMVELSNWNLKADLGKAPFSLSKPEDADTMDFRALTGTSPDK